MNISDFDKSSVNINIMFSFFDNKGFGLVSISSLINLRRHLSMRSCSPMLPLLNGLQYLCFQSQEGLFCWLKFGYVFHHYGLFSQRSSFTEIHFMIEA